MNFESVPTVEEQKEETKAMNERIKKMRQKENLETIAKASAFGALVGFIVFIVLDLILDGYL